MTCEPRLRLFVAVDVSEGVRRELARVQAELACCRARVKWVDPATIHLTLVFLGDVEAAFEDDIAAAMDRATRGGASFEIGVAGTGTFGRGRAPRVVWAGVRDPAGRLAEVQASVAAGLRGLGLDIERRDFNPHITIGRVKSPRHADELLAAVEERRDASFGTVSVDRIALYASTLTREGPIHAVRHTADLSGLDSVGRSVRRSCTVH